MPFTCNFILRVLILSLSFRALTITQVKRESVCHETGVKAMVKEYTLA